MCAPHVPRWHRLLAFLSQCLCPSALGLSHQPLVRYHKSRGSLGPLSPPRVISWAFFPPLQRAGTAAWKGSAFHELVRALASPLPFSQASGAQGTVPEPEAVAGSHQPTLCIPMASCGLWGQAENSRASTPQSLARLIPTRGGPGLALLQRFPSALPRSQGAVVTAAWSSSLTPGEVLSWSSSLAAAPCPHALL